MRRKHQSLKKLTCCKWRFAVEYSTRIQCSPRSLHSCFLKVCRSCTNDCVGSGLERDGDNGRCSVFCLDRIQVSMVITRGWNSIKGTLVRLGSAILSGLPSLRVHNIRSNISLGYQRQHHLMAAPHPRSTPSTFTSGFVKRKIRHRNFLWVGVNADNSCLVSICPNKEMFVQTSGWQ